MSENTPDDFQPTQPWERPIDETTGEMSPAASPAAPAAPAAPEAPSAPAAPAAAEAPTTWPAAYPAAGTVPVPQAGQPVYPAHTSANAVIALVVAIASWIGWGLCPVIGPIALAIVALVLGNNAAKEIRSSGGMVQGEGLITATRIIAWINIGLTAAAIIVGVFFLVLALVAGAFNSPNSF